VTDAELLARAAAWPEETTADPDADWLMELVQREGLDLATAVLYDRLWRRPANADFLRAAEQPVAIRDALIGVVPGAFHREHRNTGADGARAFAIARELRCDAELIPTASFGGVEQNAGVILEWLHEHRGRRVALISLSKGSAEVQ